MVRRIFLMDPCQHVTKRFLESSTTENVPKAHVAALHDLSFCAFWVLEPVNWSIPRKSSITDHRLDTAIWKCTAAQSAALACHINITRFTGSDHWLQYRDLPLLRRRGRWTSERTHERYIQEGTFLLHQNRLSTEIVNRLSALPDLALRFFAEQDTVTERQRIRSVLRKGVEQQSFAHSVSPISEALLSPLSDVGQKNKVQADGAHDTARTHWDDHVASAKNQYTRLFCVFRNSS